MRRASLASAVVGTLLCVSVPAAANGRFPASSQLVFSPTDKNLIFMRTSYGILRSHDNGATWSFICETALGLDPVMTEDPSIGLTNNSLLVGVTPGLDVSTDLGCNWTCIKDNGLGGQAIVDLAVRPDNPASAVAISRAYAQTDAGLTTMVTQVYETTDNGATWAPIGVPLDPTFVAQTIDVAKGDANRLYVSGTDEFAVPRTAVLLVSTDKGTTWIKQVFPTAQFNPDTEDSVYIGAIDPGDVDRVYLRSAGNVMGGQSRLTVVTSASTTAHFLTAKSFQVGMAKRGEVTGQLAGFALSPDGQKVWVGSQADGLWMASASDLVFAKKKSVIVECLATRGNELWACGAAVSGFIAGVSIDDGASFTSKLRLVGDIAGPIACTANPSGAACNATTNTSDCEAELENFCAMYTCDPDAGPTNPATPASSSCNCTFAGARVSGIAAAVGGVLALIGAAARRRRTRA
jgi:hypothetical protein